MRPYVLFAQAAFLLIGGFFFIMGAVGTLTYHPDYNSGASPVIGVFIGLPLIAVAILMTELHKKNGDNRNQQILIRCPNCGSLNQETVKYRGECGNSVNKIAQDIH